MIKVMLKVWRDVFVLIHCSVCCFFLLLLCVSSLIFYERLLDDVYL